MKPFFSHFQRSKVLRPVAVGMTFLMVHASVPAWAVVPKEDPNAPKKLKEEAKSAPATRKLEISEMKKLKGKLLGNPYSSGSAKFDLVYKGVNMRTGDYSLSANDLSYEGGYGVPVSVARSYSANCIDEGPFGIGWTLSADMRTTAGGTFKSGEAPVRSVPVNIKMRHDEESDPNLEANPIKAVIVTDSAGTETTIQVDVDGVLTTPPWEKNEYDAAFEVVWVGDTHYEILISNKTKTPDGTIYAYEKKGTYTSGLMPWNDLTSVTIDPEPSNILKVVSATDRNGNETTFTYGGSNVTFQKSNGATSEAPLTRVDMPNGRFIEFNWDGNRIIEATDNERSITYGYNVSDQLTSVTSPGGRITRYGYGYATDGTGSNVGDASLLTSITDPRGLSTTIKYALDNYSYTATENRVIAYIVSTPDGRDAHFSCVNRNGMYPPDHVSGGAAIPDPGWVFEFGAGTITPTLKQFSWTFDVVSDSYVTSERCASTKSFLHKTFDATSLNLILEQSYYGTGGGVVGNHFGKEVEKSYNFMGNPLKQITRELDSNLDPVKTYEREHGYWGDDKYYQEKVSRIKIGATSYRYNYTDYYDSSSSIGERGKVFRQYDAANSDYIIDTGTNVPAYATSGGYAWKYQIRPENEEDFTAEFNYDSVGRVTDIFKLRHIVSGTRTYTHTKSAYGTVGEPVYGNAISVIEDYGTGNINRETKNLAFSVDGKATLTVDGKGQEFQTEYDGDGNMLSITRTDCSPSVPIVSYVYGTTDGTPENGMVLSMTDEISGVVQTISYAQSGSSKGKPIETLETHDSFAYQSIFEYDSAGNRTGIRIESPTGTQKWAYTNWVTIGCGSSSSQVFSKLNKQELASGNWINGKEEFEYAYHSNGSLRVATFGQTPQSGQANYNSYVADSRARAEFSYDAGNRLSCVEYFWDSLDGSEYETQLIWASDSTYEHPLSLKDSAGFFEPNSGGSGWDLQRREEYTYDELSDFLTEADYNFGAFQTNEWEYDSNGNRKVDSANSGGWSYDALNRLTSSPFGLYTYDSNGNRLTGPGYDLEWDVVNRLKSFDDFEYSYRADGMRVLKHNPGIDDTRYTYLGQMLAEIIEDTGSSYESTGFANGARSVDAFFVDNGSSVTWSFPLYDCQGNQKAILTRASGDSFNVSAWKSYDAWGNVIDGTASKSGDYSANTGHIRDLESSFLYMRSRYYDAGVGQFISEDPSKAGINWYTYCNNYPTCAIDPKGEMTDNQNASIGFLFLAIVAYCWAMKAALKTACGTVMALGGCAFLLAWFCTPLTDGVTDADSLPSLLSGLVGPVVGAAAVLAMAMIYVWSESIVNPTVIYSMGCGSIGAEAAGVFEAYMATLGMFFALENMEQQFSQ